MKLATQELLECREFLVGTIHVGVGGLEIALAKSQVRFTHIVVQATEGGEDIAAKVVALRLLLRAKRLDAAFGGVGSSV